MGKMPAFQFYPGDWRKDVGVQSLDYFDRGVWHEMLCLMHESERRGVLVLNGQPLSDAALARLLGLDKQTLTTTLTTLLTTGVASRETETGALICRRMVRDEKLCEIRRQAGKLGGNPLLLNQKRTTQDKYMAKQSPTPSSSFSTSKTENSGQLSVIREQGTGNSPKSESANEAAPPDSVDTRILSESVGIFGMKEQAEMHRLLGAYCQSTGRSVEIASQEMRERWAQYQHEVSNLEWQFGSSYKFFMSAIWDKPEMWPLKGGGNAPKPKILTRPGE